MKKSKEMTQYIPDEVLIPFVKSFKISCLSFKEKWYIVKISRMFKINPIVSFALCQKESSLMEGGIKFKHKKNRAFGYGEDEKFNKFKTQALFGISCLAKWLRESTKEKWTIVKLQLPHKNAYVVGLNPAEAALFIYNPLIYGNKNFCIIFDNYKKRVEKIREDLYEKEIASIL